MSIQQHSLYFQIIDDVRLQRGLQGVPRWWLCCAHVRGHELHRFLVVFDNDEDTRIVKVVEDVIGAGKIGKLLGVLEHKGMLHWIGASGVLHQNVRISDDDEWATIRHTEKVKGIGHSLCALVDLYDLGASDGDA